MSMAQTPALAGGWGGSFLPLHQPIMQMPFARPRAIRLGSAALNKNIPPHLEQRFTKEQLESLFQQFPASYAALTSPQIHHPKRKVTTTSVAPTSTTTTTTTTTTSTTTTTPQPSILPRRRRPQGKDVPKFYYGGIEGREDYGVGPAEDDAVVLLVGLFNLLAIVVYAASKFVMGDRGGLSDRVIQWQVQKVLDELVIKVHSSQYMANLLSRAMPPNVVSLQEGRRVSGQTMNSWISLLREKLKTLSLHNASSEVTEWLSTVKDQLMREIGSSPAAMSTVQLHPQIYKPLKEIYVTLTSEDGLRQLLEFVTDGDETGRSLDVMRSGISGLLTTLSQLKLSQMQSMLATLTALGRAQQRIDIMPMLTAAMRSQNWLEEGSSDVETARVISEGDSFAETLAKYVVDSYRRPKQQHLNENQNDQEDTDTFGTLFEREPEGQAAPEEDSDDERSIEKQDERREEQFSNRRPPSHRRPPSSSSSLSSQLMRRQGTVRDDKTSAGPKGHWTDRWFSLVTQLSPVGLDITTLYARARARPRCLRALLCRANNAWRQVGPVQASLTPFTSVLVSWLLEDTMPHSLGDSLIAVRAGWMGKDCSILYPECPLQPDPHPAAKEAITFFSRLQFAATSPPDAAESPSGAQSGTSEDIRPSSVDKPVSGDRQTTDTLTERVDYEHTPHENRGSRKPQPGLGSSHEYPAPTPQPQFQHHKDNQRPSHNQHHLQGTENKHQVYPNRQLPSRDEGTEENAAALQAYYNRYQGQGPMVVPGSQYSSKYGHFDDGQHRNDEKLYDKYDSPSINTAEGEISGSSSVSGMALQDRPTGNNNKVWEEFFKAGLYGGIVPQSPLNIKDESSTSSAPEKSIRMPRPMKRPMLSSLNKIGALPPDQPGFYPNPGYGPYGNINKGSPKPSRPHKRPYFTLRPKRPQPTGSTLSGSGVSSAKPFIKKYKYGLRRGLPATNVNGYNAYVSNSGNIYQRQKPWYAYIDNSKNRSTQPTPPKQATPTTTTLSPTDHSLSPKDTDPFGPEDAVTDVLRNELLYEYIRDRQGSIPVEDRRSLT
ncbi:uncharacterized protein LOC135213206 [Macrobrachium nipponense]|uniref:uncharacterized protein LOC135213206 n=1 Tax=Macrobrachium nipponense TaxID=159736 RepID=UPI0030C8726D